MAFTLKKCAGISLVILILFLSVPRSVQNTSKGGDQNLFNWGKGIVRQFDIHRSTKENIKERDNLDFYTFDHLSWANPQDYWDLPQSQYYDAELRKKWHRFNPGCTK